MIIIVFIKHEEIQQKRKYVDSATTQKKKRMYHVETERNISR
jgi:hypothetical protein